VSNIKDSELLTFSNATNLDWQFVALTDNESKDSLKNNNKKKSYIIKDILTPESFVREYKDENGIVQRTEKIYDSIEEMQNSAGVLMNYLEECDKNSNEGNFLKDWEVVYGADNYASTF
jgi:hypothetical protein